MALFDRIVFGDNSSALFIALQDAGVLAVSETQMAPVSGCVLYSYIGDAYQDGRCYALITLDDALCNVPAIEARLASNIDPSRMPLRINAGILLEDPDIAAREAYWLEQMAKKDAEFAAYKAREGAPIFKAASVKIAAEKLGELANVEAAIMVLVDAASDKSLWVWWVEIPQISRADAQWQQIEAAMPKLDATALFALAKEIEG